MPVATQKTRRRHAVRPEAAADRRRAAAALQRALDRRDNGGIAAG
ncbi:hypothetical protein [Streptomyces aidingensis]|uniref:Uncharacterized protein n=1 Tax=Streptomyces aidingensis TaxID=910347 RepID=A0A1I1NUA5_9ACTN|nr:hypothetical protein [Streptomyces aidingensis]SFC99078.1 hypothetical protein SAMN05421773_10890 [Streptomyces aidingensis]